MRCPVDWIKAKLKNKNCAMGCWGYFVFLKKTQKQEIHDWRGFQMNIVFDLPKRSGFFSGCH